MSLFSVLMALQSTVSLFAMRLQTTTRAFILGEGYWSRAQKNVVYGLVKYISTENPLHYQQLLHDNPPSEVRAMGYRLSISLM